MKIVFAMIFLLGFTTIVQANKFNGKWSGETKKGYIEISINQESSSIKGTHCCIAQNGNKIDDGGKYITISGTINENIATITIISGFSNKTGTAKLTFISSNRITFELISPPKGEHYFPSKIQLTR
ncbi:hypothetical protein EYV94_25675 [Puteibacter caeruleilacunae]|nr:hypothetical protein EYV94_25675 [Puteibacter caeruleilacunae]